MPGCIRAACVAMVLSCAFCDQALAVTSAENNPFAPTLDQVQARFARIQMEVDRLRAAGLNSAADAMGQNLQHFKDELAGRAPSLIAGEELDGVSVHAAGNVTVRVHATGRPIV